MLSLSDPDVRKHANDLRGMWQGRVLDAAEGRLMLVVTSMLAHAYPEHIEVLLRVVQPKCWDEEQRALRTPGLTSIGTVDHSGRVVAMLKAAPASKPHEWVIYKSLDQFKQDLRRLADRLKLPDADRVEFFGCAQKWLASDRRVDPASGEMRLVH